MSGRALVTTLCVVLLGTFCCVCVSAEGIWDQPVIPWNEAVHYLGEAVVAEGPVASTEYGRDGTFYINVGNPSPDPNRLSIAIRPECAELLSVELRTDLNEWFAGQAIQVFGVVELGPDRTPYIWDLCDPGHVRLLDGSPLTSIPELKANWPEYIGQEVTLEGVFVSDPLPMLVTDIRHIMVNRPIPDDEYVLLVGGMAEEIDPSRFGGASLQVQGIAGDPWEDSNKAPIPGPKLVVLNFEEIGIVKRYNPQIAAPAPIPVFGEGNPDRYAILFSGGIDATMNRARYWNDLVFMYNTLINTCGFSKNNIAVLYADGKAKNSSIPVHYAATETNLAQVFQLLRKCCDANDLVFVFTTNHGGGFDDEDKWTYGGQISSGPAGDEGTESISETTYSLDLNGDGDTKDSVAWDEELCTWGGGIMDDPFAGYLNGLVCDTLIVLLEQCFSGGFIRDISLAPGGPADIVVMSAAREHESSWTGCSQSSYDEFSYLFTCALNGATPTGTAVDADTNNDGHVSMVEAFNYAQKNDKWNTGGCPSYPSSWDETPLYEDNGDGTPHSGNMPSGGDGALGSTVWLD